MVFWSNDLEMTSLAYGLLLGAVGAGFSSFGLSIWASITITSRNARRLLGPEGQDAQGKVLRKTISPEVPEPPRSQPTPGIARTFYLVSYVFEAVRSDTMTCRVEVRERKVPSFVWQGLKEGGSVTIRYLKREPRQCRILAAGEHEKGGARSMRVRAVASVLFFTVGAVAAILSVLDHHVAGIILWGAVVLFSLLWQLTGRRFLQAACPCLRHWLRRPWSPLFTHAGYVFCKELGKGVEPSTMPEPVLPEDVDVFLDTSMDAPFLNSYA